MRSLKKPSGRSPRGGRRPGVSQGSPEKDTRRHRVRRERRDPPTSEGSHKEPILSSNTQKKKEESEESQKAVVSTRRGVEEKMEEAKAQGTNGNITPSNHKTSPTIASSSPALLLPTPLSPGSPPSRKTATFKARVPKKKYRCDHLVSVSPITITPTSITPTSITPTSITPTSITPTSITPTSITPTSITPTSITPTSITPTSITPTSITPTSITPTSTLELPNSSHHNSDKNSTSLMPRNNGSNYISISSSLSHSISGHIDSAINMKRGPAVSGVNAGVRSDRSTNSKSISDSGSISSPGSGNKPSTQKENSRAPQTNLPSSRSGEALREALPQEREAPTGGTQPQGPPDSAPSSSTDTASENSADPEGTEATGPSLHRKITEGLPHLHKSYPREASLSEALAKGLKNQRVLARRSRSNTQTGVGGKAGGVPGKDSGPKSPVFRPGVVRRVSGGSVEVQLQGEEEGEGLVQYPFLEGGSMTSSPGDGGAVDFILDAPPPGTAPVAVGTRVCVPFGGEEGKPVVFREGVISEVDPHPAVSFPYRVLLDDQAHSAEEGGVREEERRRAEGQAVWVSRQSLRLLSPPWEVPQLDGGRERERERRRGKWRRESGGRRWRWKGRYVS
ncbi:hypothetical protein NHX12_000729 [Muraenolepis orangiensis]|uniref:Protein capicua homolog-like domain-containing protein n=1 Tax=Muraenolepis orangiensis TaxID=630683 RepID=A0A9Q0IIW5_9TELE|nr:hypothetical protein NHX12_000729 [Muraenolepis orangiensis]